MKKAILRVFFKPLTIINRIKKKDEKLIFFYSNLGFRDNVKAFYDYLIENNYNEQFKIVVSINDWEQYVKRAPKNVTFINNKQGIKWFMKAKYAFYCFGKYPIKPSKKQTVINLWHGTPLKRIGHLEKGCENIDYDFFSKVLTSAPMYKPIMADIFGCTENRVEVMGNPRNDEMFKKDRIKDDYIKGGAGKLILWLPTYREYDEGFIISILNKDELNSLNTYLMDNNIKMIVKLHPLQMYPDIYVKQRPDKSAKKQQIFQLQKNNILQIYLPFLLTHLDWPHWDIVSLLPKIQYCFRSISK